MRCQQNNDVLLDIATYIASDSEEKFNSCENFIKFIHVCSINGLMKNVCLRIDEMKICYDEKKYKRLLHIKERR